MHFHGPIVRPPMDADSIFIEVTVGCSHNSCTFCNYYEGYPFRVAPLEQIEEDLQEASVYYVPGRSKVWASGGNPFALSAEKLIALGKLFNYYLPQCRIMTYARIDDIDRKNVDELKEIKEAGFHDIVIGVESGDDDVLSAVRKGYTAREVLSALTKLDAAGFTYRCIYLGGLAGAGKCVASARTTAAVFNQVRPRLLILTMVDIFPGTQLYDERANGTFTEASEREKIEEYRALIAALDIPVVVQGHSASSSLQFRAELPAQKADILKALDDVLAHFTQADEERLARYRNSMTSA